MSGEMLPEANADDDGESDVHNDLPGRMCDTDAVCDSDKLWSR